MNEVSPTALFLEKNRQRAFGNGKLIPHQIRSYNPPCWVRVYSLPQAKRYPETQIEWETLLTRHNDIIEYLTTTDNHLYFIESTIVSGEAPYSNPRSPCLDDFNFEDLPPVDLSQEDPHLYDAGDRLQNRLTIIEWKRRQLDELFRAFATDALQGFFLTANGENWIIPYDGGIDLLFSTATKRNECAERFKEWKSDRSDGL